MILAIRGARTDRAITDSDADLLEGAYQRWRSQGQRPLSEGLTEILTVPRPRRLAQPAARTPPYGLGSVLRKYRVGEQSLWPVMAAILNKMGWEEYGPGLGVTARRDYILRVLAEEQAVGWADSPAPGQSLARGNTDQALRAQPNDPGQDRQTLGYLRAWITFQRWNPGRDPVQDSRGKFLDGYSEASLYDWRRRSYRRPSGRGSDRRKFARQALDILRPASGTRRHAPRPPSPGGQGPPEPAQHHTGSDYGLDGDRPDESGLDLREDWLTGPGDLGGQDFRLDDDDWALLDAAHRQPGCQQPRQPVTRPAPRRGATQRPARPPRLPVRTWPWPLCASVWPPAQPSLSGRRCPLPLLHRGHGAA